MIQISVGAFLAAVRITEKFRPVNGPEKEDVRAVMREAARFPALTGVQIPDATGTP